MTAISKFNYQVGDAVELCEDVLERHSRSVPAHMGYTTGQFAWRDRLRSLEGKNGVITGIYDTGHVNVDFAGVTICIQDSELVPA